jgi:hypothetical protein
MGQVFKRDKKVDISIVNRRPTIRDGVISFLD